MGIEENSLPVNAIITSGGKQIYGLGIDPKNSEIYLGDAIDNIQPGNVYRYSADGKLIHSFQAGVSPGEFLFVK